MYRVNEKGDNDAMLDPLVRRQLEGGAFAFIDAGCASGESIDHCQRRFGLGRGLGLDWYGQDLDTARSKGLAVAHCDLVSEPFPDRCVEFISMVDFLEHLPDLETATRILSKCARASRRFLFIRHPSFDHGDYLSGLGLKLAWTDWSAHPNPIRLEEFRGLFDRLGFDRYDIIPDQPILDSSHPAILPMTAASDTEEYDAAIHEPKRFVTFDRVVYGKYDIFVCLDPAVSIDAWRQLASIDGWRAVWESPCGKRRAREPGMLAHVLDALTRRYASAGPQPSAEDWTGLQALVEREIRACPRRALQFVHVLDAFGRTSGARRIYAIGDGASLPAGYLTARFPYLQVDVANPEPSSYDFVFAADAPAIGRDRRRDDLDRWTRPGGSSCVAPIDSSLGESIEGLLDRLDDSQLGAILPDALALARLDLDPARRARLMSSPPDLARVFDPLLARSGRPLPEVPEPLAPFLRRHVVDCLGLKRYFFLRLAHLADAVGRIPEPITDVLAIGVGMAYQEAFLAARLPSLRVLATDVTRTSGEFPIPNLRFGHLDLLEPPGHEQYDLVFSIECLEHIQDYRRAFRHKAARVRAGGFLYISVPFASRAQQQDPELQRTVWREAEHYTPGFTFDDLEQLFEENDLEVMHASNMFHLDVVLPVRRIIDRLSPDAIEERAMSLAQLLLLDVEDRRAADSLHSEGVRFLGRKRQAAVASPRRPSSASDGGLDPKTRADLSSGVYAFLDGGCGTGGSIDHCERRFARRPGLGLDADGNDLRTAAARGYRVAHCDLQKFQAPRACVEFASLMDVLEHLPDVAAAHRVIEQFGRAARDFLFIRHPSFEDMDDLADHGLKIGWTDWTKHPNRMRLADFRHMFSDLGWHDVVIRPTMPMSDSTHGAVVPISAPPDAEKYVAALHGPKPFVTFDPVIFGKFDIFVRLNPRLSDAEWSRITALDGWEGTWAPPGDKKIADDTAARRHNGKLPPPTDSDAHAIVDAMLWRRVRHAAPLVLGQREAVLDALRLCVVERDLGALHLVHLLDAFNHITDVRRVLAAGSGGDAHAALLSARCPDVVVDREPKKGDEDGYGFVFSLERRGHPRLDADRLRMLISHVRRGGWLYVAVPEGGTAAVPAIEACLREQEYETIACASAFATDLSTALETLVTTSDRAATAASVVDLLRLAILDLDPPRHRPEARTGSGVKYLVRRRP